MGISRDSIHKRRATSGRRKWHRKKRKYELGRQPASTRIGAKRVRVVRVRGGNKKFRALRLEAGNFAWGSEAVTRKSRVLGVVYNASNNELVRTNTLVKNCIIQLDATPFRQWYEKYYEVPLGKKKVAPAAQVISSEEVAAAPTSSATPSATSTATAQAQPPTVEPAKKPSKHVVAKIAHRQKTRVLEKALEDQFNTGRLLACVSSRPGQSGRCDGYILEGKELEFYLKKIKKK